MKNKLINRITVVILALALILSMAACGSAKKGGETKNTTSSDATTASNEKNSGDTSQSLTYDKDGFVTTTGSEPNVLDVVRFTGLADRSVFYNIYEPLVRIENGIVVPAGAESYEVSEDGLLYTFHLRENYWSDGQKVVSADYAEPLFRQANPDNAFAFASDIFCISNFEAAFKGEADVTSIGVETPDDNTLVIKLSKASPALLSSFDFFPERSDLVSKYGDRLGTEADTLISNGPFVLKSWTHNSELVFAKNERYWDAANVKLTGYALEIITDSTAAYNAFQAGEIDWLSVSDADEIAALRLRDDVYEDTLSSTRTSMFVFNATDDLFKNEKVRLAFSLALDREAIVRDLYNGLGTPAYGLVPASCGVASSNFRSEVKEPLLDYTGKDAKELLKEGLLELGLSDDPSKISVTVSFGGTSSQSKTFGEYYQQLWKKALGINIVLEFNDLTTHLANSRSGAYQVAQISWGSNFEPQFQLSRWVGGGQSQVANEEYDALVKKAIATNDAAERLRLYAQAEKILVGTAKIAPIYYTQGVRFAYNYIGGLTLNNFDNTGMKNVYVHGR